VRAVLQRVTEAQVSVAGSVVARIGSGLVALVGVEAGDEEATADRMARDIARIRIFSDPDGRMNLSIKEISGSVLLVSQFTLIADTRKGRRPSFIHAADPELAAPLLERLARSLEEEGVSVGQGRFGANMQVEIHNDGPVTIVLDTAT
jgi:D-tyrosyl-tRNA(Tyr) deacylase